MRFCLLDRIVELEPGVRIKAVKRLRPDEDYLQDHFPRFPVMPGVLMLEAMYQASAWLVRQSEGFANSMVVLKEARNVKYGSFVAPGNFLRVEVDFLKDTDAGASFKAAGSVNDNQALSARVELAYFNLGEKQPELAALDSRMIEHTKARWNVLQQGSKHANVA